MTIGQEPGPEQDGPPAVSRIQEGFWFLDRLLPPDVPLTVARAHPVAGPLDVPAVRAAWHRAQQRHRMLRTRFADAGGHPRPIVVAEPHPDGFRFVDGSEPYGPPVDAEDERRRAATVRFDAGTGPLARLTVITAGPQRHLLVLAAHPLVADHDSLDLLVAELLGRESCAGTRQYDDYVRLERAAEQGRDGQRRVRWWRSFLRHAAPPEIRIPALAAGGPTAAFDWGADLAAAVRALARAEGTTPAVVALAGVQALLARHRRYGTVIGLPVSLRGCGDDRTIGPFTTVQPLVAEPTAGLRFHELIRRVDATIRDVTRHRLALPALVREVAAPRTASGMPLCDVLVDARTAPVAAAGAPVADDGWGDLPPTGLGWRLVVGPAAVTGSLTAAPGLLHRSEVEGLPEQLHALLAAGTADPAAFVDDLPLERFPEPEPVDDVADGPTVLEMLAWHATRTPDAVAVDDGVPLRYGELWHRAGRLATRLRAAGLAPGDPVAVRLEPGASLVTVSLAVLRAGGHVTWLSPGDVGDRSRLVLAELRPVLLVSEAGAADDPVVRWFRDRPGDVFPVGPDVDAADGAAPDTDTAATPADLAYVAYTSGTTGRPKGVAQTHAALAQFATWLAQTMGLRPGSRLAQWAALEHDPSLCETFAALVAGATVCPVPTRLRAHPERFAAWLDSERITALQTVPTFARELLAVFTGTGPPGLAVLVLMGEAFPAHLARGLVAALPGTRLLNVYGPTETVAATWWELDPSGIEDSVPIGRPIPGRQVLVLDEADRPCPRGVRGELVIRSPYAIRGYLGPAAGPRAVLRPVAGLPADPPTYRTGDLARRGFTGLLEYAGRRDHQVKLAGVRLELAAVEAALAEMPSVADCAVLPVSRDGGPVERLVAWVVPRGSADPAGWRAHLRRRFGPAMLRLTVAELAVVPRTLAGKVDRSRLPAPGEPDGRVAPLRTPTQHRLATLWAEAGVPCSGAGADFFAAGGDSATLLCLAGGIRRAFDVPITVQDLLDDPTLAAMAAAVDTAGARRHEPPSWGPGAGSPSETEGILQQ